MSDFSPELKALDLDPIKNRFIIVHALVAPSAHESLWAAANAQSAADVPGLLREVERLRAELLQAEDLAEKNHRLYLAAIGVDPDGRL